MNKDKTAFSEVGDTRPLLEIKLEWVGGDGPYKYSHSTRYATVSEIRRLYEVMQFIDGAISEREGLLTDDDMDIDAEEMRINWDDVPGVKIEGNTIK